MFISIKILNKSQILNTNPYIDLLTILLFFILLYAWRTYIERYYLLGIDNMLYYLPAFLIGFYCAKYELHHSSKRKTSLFIFLTCIILLFILSYLSLTENTTIAVDLAVRITSCAAAVSTLVMTNNIKIPNKYISIINNLDQNSMGIYIFNQIIVFIVLLIPASRQYLEIHYLIGPFIIFFVSFLIPWGLAVLFNKTKILSWMIGT